MVERIGQEEQLVHELQGTPSTQAVGTVQASPTPTATQFSITPTSAPFRQGEAYIAGVSAYITSYSAGVVQVQPLTAAPTAGQQLEQDVPQYFAPFTATGASNGSPADTEGFNGHQYVELVNTGSGTCTVNIEGSDGELDNAGNQIWYAARYQQVDNVASPTAAVAAISVTAGNTTTFAHKYQVLDEYRYVRARVSSATAGISLTAEFIGTPI